MRAARLWAGADIRQRRWALLALAVLVALPVGFSLALVAGAQRAGASVDRFVTSSQLADVVVFVDGEPDAGLLADLAADRRVVSIDRSDPVVVVAGAMEPGEYAFALVGTDTAPAGGLAAPMLLSGRYPRPDAATEIVVNERAAQANEFEVGMAVPLSGLVSFGTEETRPLDVATIVGIVRIDSDLVDSPSDDSYLIAGPGFLDGAWRELARPGTILWLRLAEGADVGTVVSDLSTIVDGDVRGGAETLNTARDAADLQRRGLLLAGGVVAAAGLLVVAQAVARHLAARSGDSEVLGAIGLTRGERWIAGMSSVAPALAAGVVAGAVLAVALSPLLPLGLPRRADPDLGFHADWLVLAAGLTVTATLIFAVGASAVWRWLRAAPERVDARPALAAQVGPVLALRPVPLTGSRLALESGRGRRRLPVVATLVAMVATTAVVVGSMVVAASLDGLVATAERYGQPWDVFVTSVHDAELLDLGRQLEGDARVTGVDLARSGELNVTTSDGVTTQIGATGLDGATGPMWLAVLDGRAPGGPAEIAVAPGTMDQLGLDIDATVTVSGPCGERTVRVVGRAIAPVMLNSDPDHGSVVTGGLFHELCADELIAEVDRSYGALIRLNDPSDAEALLAETFPEGAFSEWPMTPSAITALAEIGQVPILIAALVGLIGTAAAANALVLAGRRRDGDLAILRTLGMRSKDIRRAFGWQAATMVGVAATIGVPTGVMLGRVVWTGIARPANVLIHVDIGLAPLVVPATLLAVLLVFARWPGHRAVRLTPAEVLRSE